MINDTCLQGTVIKNDFLKFWKLYDAIYHTIHSQVIKFLYFNAAMTFDDISLECNIDVKTLYRYRKKYLLLFDVLNEDCNKRNPR